MNIEFECTIDDVIDFNLFHNAHSSSIQQQLVGAQIFIGILATSLVFGITYIAYHKLNIPMSIIGILVGVLASILYPQVNRKATIRRVKKLLAEGDNKTCWGIKLFPFPGRDFC